MPKTIVRGYHRLDVLKSVVVPETTLTASDQEAFARAVEDPQPTEALTALIARLPDEPAPVRATRKRKATKED
jgi:hypothetical protein